MTKQSTASTDDPLFRLEPFDSEGTSRLIREFGNTYTNGGALFATFSVTSSERYWFLRNQKGIFRTNLGIFLVSPALKEALPALRSGEVLGDPDFQQRESLSLDGDLAAALVGGGAYGRFQGSPRQAKVLAQTFTDAWFDDRYLDVRVFRSEQHWSPWFRAVAWDRTWILVDVKKSRVCILCVTDSDV